MSRTLAPSPRRRSRSRALGSRGRHDHPAWRQPVACAIGEIPVIRALKDAAIILVPMLGVLLLVILLPDPNLALPRLLMPRFVN